MQAGPAPAAEALADAAARGDSAALAALLPPLGPRPPQAALDAALLAAAGAWTNAETRKADLDAAAALLLGAGAAVHAVDERGATPLHLAARCGNVPLLRRLLAAGARADAPAGQDHPHFGGLPHHLAASHGHCEALALLLDSGAPVRPLLGSAELRGKAEGACKRHDGAA
jgi:ankyrin repeat protein